MWISSWLHAIPRVLINGSIPGWRDVLGGMPWYSALHPVKLTVLIIYHWIKIEDMLIKFAGIKIGRVRSILIDGFVIQYNPK